MKNVRKITFLTLAFVVVLATSKYALGGSIFEAIERNDITEVRNCIADKSFDINKADNSKHGETPLYLAVLKGNLEIVKELLNAGAKIDDMTLNQAQKNKNNKIFNLLRITKRERYTVNNKS